MVGASAAGAPELFRRCSRVSGGQSVRRDSSEVLTRNARRFRLGTAASPGSPWQPRAGRRDPPPPAPRPRPLRPQCLCLCVGNRRPGAPAPPGTASQQHWGRPTGGGRRVCPAATVLSKEVLRPPRPGLEEIIGVQFRMYVGSSHHLFFFFFFDRIERKIATISLESKSPPKTLENGE